MMNTSRQAQAIARQAINNATRSAYRIAVRQRMPTRYAAPRSVHRILAQRFASTTHSPEDNHPSGTESSNNIARAQELMDNAVKHLQEGELDQAEDKYAQSIKVSPSAAGYYNLGVVQAQQGRLRDAIDSFESSLGLSAQPDCHSNIATCYLYLQQQDKEGDAREYVQKAKAHLNSALELSPGDGEIAFNLGATHEASGELDTALDMYKKAKSLGVPAERVDVLIRNVGAKILGEEAGKSDK